MRGWLAAIVVAGCAGAGVALATADDQAADTQASPRTSSVGMPVRIEQLMLPGSELEARPIADRETPIVLRVVDAFRHGSGFRYDLEYYGLEPGTYDLRDYFRRKDGSGTEELPAIVVEITSLLPPGQVLPHALEPRPTPRLGGYRALLVAAGVLWIAGLIAIRMVGRQRRRAQAAASVARISLAERLEPLVRRAIDGELTPKEEAELERLLLDYWRQRLQLDDSDPALALAELREHPEAGELLRNVETWLHSPEGAGQVNIAEVMQPYRDLPHEPEQQSASTVKA